VQSDQTLCTGSTDESESGMDDCGLIPRMGRGFSFATSFSLIMRPAQYPIQLTILFPSNKAIGNKAKTPESSTGCLFYRVPEHRDYNGQMQTIYVIKLPCTMIRQEGNSLVPSLYMHGVNKTYFYSPTIT
jgi:hypothetical protein